MDISSGSMVVSWGDQGKMMEAEDFSMMFLVLWDGLGMNNKGDLSDKIGFNQLEMMIK